MTDEVEKGYTKKKFRRKIPKVGRSYKRHLDEDKTFDKSEDESEMVKSIDALMYEILEKGNYKIGDEVNGYKKIAEGTWEPIYDEIEIKKSNSQENNMSDINKEMDEMADKMVKSADPKAVLKSTIEEIGVEGLKKAMPNLDEEQKELLKSVLEEIKIEKGAKAVSMDDVYDGDKKFITVNKMGVEEEDGSDDEDEKLVKPEASTITHQGDISPEGREGQVIKSEDLDKVINEQLEKSYKACGACKEYTKACKACGDANNMMKSEDEYEMPKKEAIKEHERLVNVLESDSHKDDKKEAKKQKKELKDMKKSEETTMTKEQLIALKDEVVKSYEDAGLSYNEELIKSEMKKRLLKEEDQVKQPDATAGKTKADKAAPEDIKPAKDADTKADDVKVKKSESEAEGEEAPEKIQKSVVYDSPNKRLLANTGGRNHHFSINNYYDEALRKSAAGESTEDLKKSEGEEETADGINDLIEKGLDMGSDECKTEQIFKSQNKGEYVAKSFSDEDMVEAMNLSEEDAKKVLGE